MRDGRHFAARLAARSPRDPLADLARAALRLLPAAVAVALLLAWMAARPVGSAAHSAGSAARPAPAEDRDLLRWVAGDPGARP